MSTLEWSSGKQTSYKDIWKHEINNNLGAPLLGLPKYIPRKRYFLMVKNISFVSNLFVGFTR